MGSSSSITATATTHKQAVHQTEFTRGVMDQILNYMIKQISIRDLLQMSKPSECKKYVLFKANSIYQHFYELRIFPSKDSKGILTFRKVDDLVNPKGDQEKERQSLCLIVAYFYTRIFQIYGALALTVIDDMNAMTSSGIMSLPLGYDARLQPPGYYPQNVYDPRYQRVGGGPSSNEFSKDKRESLMNFEWIRSFLTSEYTSSLGFKTRFVGTSSERSVVYLKLDNVLKDKDKHAIPSYGPPSVESRQDAIFFIGMSGMSKYATLELYTLVSPGEIKVKTIKLKFTNQYEESVNTNQFEKTFRVDREQETGKGVKYTIQGMDVFLYLANYFSDIVQYLKDAMKVHKNANNNSRALSTVRRSENGISEHLQLEEMIDNLMKRKPLSPCISRVLQLLKTEPFENEPGMSQICSATFAENKRLGVVKPGASLSKSPGLFALANLFYDTITIGSPNLSIGTDREDRKPSSMDQYVAFMKNLSEKYALDKTPRTAEEYEQKGLAGIKNRRDEEKCQGITTDIPLSLETTRKVHGVIKTMFHDQVQHATRCLEIVNMLFKITYETTEDGKKRIRSLNLSDALIVKGFPELYRINRLARELLIGYHSNCENKYETAVGYIIDAKDAKKKAENAAAAAKPQQAVAAANPQRVVAANPQQAVAAANPKPTVAAVQAQQAAVQAQQAAVQQAAKHMQKKQQKAAAALAQGKL